MPASATYDSIATYTGDGSFNAPIFSNIPQTYTDLVLVVQGRLTGAVSTGVGVLRLNDDAGTNYSWTTLLGDGSSVASIRTSNGGNGVDVNSFPGASATANFVGQAVIHIPNYRSTSMFKNVIFHNANDANGGGTTRIVAGLWRSTAAINDVRLISSSGNWAAGSFFTLYGITAA